MRVAVLAVLAVLALAAAPAAAGEVFAGLLAHAVNLRGTPPPPFDLYEGQEEQGTQDLEFGWRSDFFGSGRVLEMRGAVKAQVNLDGRTSFFAAGFDFRKPFLRDRLYAQIGIGLAYQTGYRFIADPFEPGLSQSEFNRRYDIYLNRTAFGSKLLFNPNAAVGVRLSPRLALEGTWEHYSHAQLFSNQNPGIDSFGARLVWRY